MPREQINRPQFGEVIDPGNSNVPPGERVDSESAALHVGWNPNCWVQVSIEADPSYFKLAADHPDGENGRTAVYTPPLSREDLNKLIRVLRRARDAAYGRDE